MGFLGNNVLDLFLANKMPSKISPPSSPTLPSCTVRQSGEPFHDLQCEPRELKIPTSCCHVFGNRLCLLFQFVHLSNGLVLLPGLGLDDLLNGACVNLPLLRLDAFNLLLGYGKVGLEMFGLLVHKPVWHCTVVVGVAMVATE